jgi:hypothetical protein
MKTIIMSLVGGISNRRSFRAAPTARPHTSLGQRPRNPRPNIKRAESPFHPCESAAFVLLCTNQVGRMDRAVGAWGFRIPGHGAMPHAGIERAVGPKLGGIFDNLALNAA